MKRWLFHILLLLPWTALIASGYSVSFPTAPAAGVEGSTAIYMGSSLLVGWADGYTNLVYGDGVAPQWQVPANGLGAAQGTSSDIVCLGRGGQITLTFSQGISDGDGFDFAVFENALNDAFLELAWVEVSSDGIHFVRFPNFSDTPDPVDAFGDVNPVQLYGYAGKYRQGYGIPFDLAELMAVSNSIAAGGHNLTDEYVASFSANIAYLDPAHIRYVRLIDVVGDGTCLDCEGFAIYDPYPTAGSAGFDLDAVGVIHSAEVAGLAQTITFSAIPHQKLSFGSVTLNADADSGLPVEFSVLSGPAAITNNVLYFSAPGNIEVVANQSGSDVYAPAAAVMQSFVVAEAIQHIFFEPVSCQVVGGSDVKLYAESSQGLPVSVEVFAAPDHVLVDTNLVMQLGNETGSVMLRAFQSGSATVAPAKDVFVFVLHC